MIASRSFSIAASVVPLLTLMTTESFPLASRSFSDTAPRSAGSSAISSSLTARGAGAVDEGALGGVKAFA